MNSIPAGKRAQPPPWPRVAGWTKIVVLLAVVQVIGHDLTFLAHNGLEGLAIRLDETGHGAYWPFTWLVAASGAVLLAAAGALRAITLCRLLGAATPRPSAAAVRRYVEQVLRLAPRLALVTFVAFVVQEAAEHYVRTQEVLALESFVHGSYTPAVPAFLGTALAVAAVACAFSRALDALEAVIAESQRLPRAAAVLHNPALDAVRSLTPRALPDGRAPPLATA